MFCGNFFLYGFFIVEEDNNRYFFCGYNNNGNILSFWFFFDSDGSEGFLFCLSLRVVFFISMYWIIMGMRIVNDWRGL